MAHPGRIREADRRRRSGHPGNNVVAPIARLAGEPSVQWQNDHPVLWNRCPGARNLSYRGPQVHSEWRGALGECQRPTKVLKRLILFVCLLGCCVSTLLAVSV